VTAAVDRLRVMAALRLPPARRHAVDQALVAARRRLIADLEAGRKPGRTGLQAALAASLAPSSHSQ
jgi:hypothetical protein